MSKAKNRERAEKEGPSRDGKRSKIAVVGPEKAANMVPIKCVYPPCTTSILVPPPAVGVTVGTPQHVANLGGIPLCPQHGEWLAFYVWAQINIKLQAQQTAGGLITPGHNQFKPTLDKQLGRP
ncbi:hypothetical protein CMI37_17915 [Candidatus Pacearchaeota archaeon]|nr:hypothetical protein [Candidatus Pacearchaeota archaeon]